MMIEVAALEQRLGYQFSNRQLLERALTHRSFLFERLPPEARTEHSHESNESLEFLGDSVLGFIASEILFLRHPGADEGELSRRRASVVSAVHLHHCAVEMGLGAFLRLGRAEERNGGRERRAMLADAVEAVLAAVYLDGGMSAAKSMVERFIVSREDPQLGEVDSTNFKGALQEVAQAEGLPVPRYSIVSTEGPEHARTFTVEVRIDDCMAAQAQGATKKAASQVAAKLLFERLKDNRRSLAR